MFNFFKKDKERNSHAFLKMFPSSFHTDVKIVTQLLPGDTHPPHEGDSFIVDSERVQIYSRIYKPEPAESPLSLGR